MNRGEELRAKLKVMFVTAWNEWTPEERARLLAKLPRYMKNGLVKMIEQHNGGGIP